MKKSLSLLLAVMMIVALLVPAASAAGAYEGKTVVIYTGNLNGDVDLYAKVAAAKADYAAKGADVLLVGPLDMALHGQRVIDAVHGEMGVAFSKHVFLFCCVALSMLRRCVARRQS